MHVFHAAFRWHTGDFQRCTDWQILVLSLMAAAVGSFGNWCCTGCWFETKCSLAIISMKERARQSLHPIIPSSEVACQASCSPIRHTRVWTHDRHAHTHTSRCMFTHKMTYSSHNVTHRLKFKQIFTNICVKTYTLENIINV